MDPATSMRILVIDDNPDDRELVLHEARILFPDSDIRELASIPALETALLAGEPNLVVTDLDLKFIEGSEVLSIVKARYPNCPVVMYTGTGNETVAVELMKAGLDDYVVKAPHQLFRLRMSLKRTVEFAKSRTLLNDREARLASALERQRILTRELHHRVKNNLQTVSSLLHFGAHSADETTRRHLAEIAGRMEALGAVQMRIYDTMELNEVDFRLVFNDIASSLISVRETGMVTLDNRVMCPLDLEVARAMPLSLVCYEVILNALKHAWPNGQGGTLTVEIKIKDGEPELIIADDGAGFNVEDRNVGLGSRLIRGLASEAGFSIVISSQVGTGTRVSLRQI